MTADHSGANKHWMNQRNLMRASIRNHRVYLYIRDIIDISKLNTCQKEELHCKSTRRTSEHLTSAIGRKTLSFFSVGTFTLPKSLLDGRVRFKGVCMMDFHQASESTRLHHANWQRHQWLTSDLLTDENAGGITVES